MAATIRYHFPMNPNVPGKPSSDSRQTPMDERPPRPDPEEAFHVLQHHRARADALARRVMMPNAASDVILYAMR